MDIDPVQIQTALDCLERHSSAATAFLAAHKALAGEPSGGIESDITVSNFSAGWHYSAELLIGRKFAGSDLAKSAIAITACIGPHWAESEPQDWEVPVAADDLVPLGAEPIKPWGCAEKAWKVHALMKSPTTHILMPCPVIVVQRAHIAIAHRCLGNLSHRRAATKKLKEEILARVTKRLHPDPSSPVSQWAEQVLSEIAKGTGLPTLSDFANPPKPVWAGQPLHNESGQIIGYAVADEVSRLQRTRGGIPTVTLKGSIHPLITTTDPGN